jgi:hypothetical protein
MSFSAYDPRSPLFSGFGSSSPRRAGTPTRAIPKQLTVPVGQWYSDPSALDVMTSPVLSPTGAVFSPNYYRSAALCPREGTPRRASPGVSSTSLTRGTFGAVSTPTMGVRSSRKQGTFRVTASSHQLALASPAATVRNRCAAAMTFRLSRAVALPCTQPPGARLHQRKRCNSPMPCFHRD